MVTAVYPGTFDPITHGHTDLVERASSLFSRVVVAVASNPGKNPVFTLEERLAFVNEVVAPWPNVEVRAFDTLLVDLARSLNARVVLRGLRAVSDFEYEIQLAGMNRRLAPEVETLFLPPGERYLFVSSSLVREIAQLGGDVTEFVAPSVQAALKARLRK